MENKIIKYTISYKRSVAKELRKIEKTDLIQIISKTQSLAYDPYPAGVAKLVGSPNRHRIRHGDYRILYEINTVELIILVVKVGHRREVYKNN